MRITIVIPAYNAEKYLAASLDSCVAQTYKDIEVLVVNDGSNDNTKLILEQYIEKYSNVRTVYQENRGLVEARKTGVRSVNTEFFIFLDADDTLEPIAIEKLVEEQNRTSADLIFSNFYVENEKGRILFLSNNNFEEGVSWHAVLNSILKKKVFPPIWGRLIKTSLFKQTETPSNITIAEDAAALVQLLRLEPKISYINDNIYHYVQRDSSMVNKKNRKLQTQRLVFLNWFVPYMTNNFAKKDVRENMNIFVLSELFTFLRDGGSFNDIQVLYTNATCKKDIFNYSKSIGTQRTLMLYLFSTSDFLGRVYRTIYTSMRSYLHRR